MKIDIEYITFSGEPQKTVLQTLDAEIVEVSTERRGGEHVGEWAGETYRDIIINRSYWDFHPDLKIPEDAVREERFALDSQKLRSLTKALRARQPEELKGKRITVLYDDSSYVSGSRRGIIGIVRPSDSVVIEK